MPPRYRVKNAAHAADNALRGIERLGELSEDERAELHRRLQVLAAFAERPDHRVPIDSMPLHKAFVSMKASDLRGAVPTLERIRSMGYALQVVERDEFVAKFCPLEPAGSQPAQDNANGLTGPGDRTTCEPHHSADFTDVNWFGTCYSFDDGQQCKAIGCLWAEYEKGEHGLSEKTIGEAIGSANSNYRLSNTFRLQENRKRGTRTTMHPAWGTMIQKVRPGVYRLKRPGITA